MIADVFRRYRSYDPETGTFQAERGVREYGRLLDINSGQLSQILNGEREPGRKLIRRFLRVFPAAAPEITDAMLASNGHNPAPQPVAAGGGE